MHSHKAVQGPATSQAHEEKKKKEEKRGKKKRRSASARESNPGCIAKRPCKAQLTRIMEYDI